MIHYDPPSLIEYDEILEVSIARLEERLTQSGCRSELFECIMDEVFHFLDAEQGHIILLKKDGTLDIPASRLGLGRNYTPDEDPVSRSVLSVAIMGHRGIITNDALADPRFSASESVIQLNLHSIICAPLVTQGKMIGAIYLETRAKTGQFSLRDLEILEAFSEYAAKAIEKSNLINP